MCASIARERQMRIYENVTRVIIEEMERGAVPRVRPWKTDRRGCSVRTCSAPILADFRRLDPQATPVAWQRPYAAGRPRRGNAEGQRPFVRSRRRGRRLRAHCGRSRAPWRTDDDRPFVALSVSPGMAGGLPLADVLFALIPVTLCCRSHWTWPKPEWE